MGAGDSQPIKLGPKLSLSKWVKPAAYWFSLILQRSLYGNVSVEKTQKRPRRRRARATDAQNRMQRRNAATRVHLMRQTGSPPTGLQSGVVGVGLSHSAWQIYRLAAPEARPLAGSAPCPTLLLICPGWLHVLKQLSATACEIRKSFSHPRRPLQSLFWHVPAKVTLDSLLKKRFNETPRRKMLKNGLFYGQQTPSLFLEWI